MAGESERDGPVDFSDFDIQLLKIAFINLFCCFFFYLFSIVDRIVDIYVMDMRRATSNLIVFPEKESEIEDKGEYRTDGNPSVFRERERESLKETEENAEIKNNPRE